MCLLRGYGLCATELPQVFTYLGGLVLSGHVTFFGSAAVDWGSHTKSVVAMSTMESEIFATTKGTQSLLHVRTLLHEH